MRTRIVHAYTLGVNRSSMGVNRSIHVCAT
jgi:hypothetical protein